MINYSVKKHQIYHNCYYHCLSKFYYSYSIIYTKVVNKLIVVIIFDLSLIISYCN